METTEVPKQRQAKSKQQGRGNTRSPLSSTKPSSFAMPCCPHCLEYGDENELRNHPQGFGRFCSACGYQDEEANQPELSHGFTARRRDAEGEFIDNANAVDHRIKDFLNSPMGLDLKIITNYLLIDPATRILPFAAHRISREACRLHLELLKAHKERQADARAANLPTSGMKWNEKYSVAAAVKIACSRHNESLVAERRQGELAESSKHTKEVESIIPPSVRTIATRLSLLYPPIDGDSDSFGEITPLRLGRIISRAMTMLGFSSATSTDVMARVQPIFLHLEDLQSAMRRGDDESVFETLLHRLAKAKDLKAYRQKWQAGSKTQIFVKDIDLQSVRSLVDDIFLITSVIGLWDGCLAEGVAAGIVLTALEAEAGWKVDPLTVIEEELSAISDCHGYTMMEQYYKLREVAIRWAQSLPKIGIPLQPLPHRRRKHTAEGAWGGLGYLGDIRRSASLRDMAAARWKPVCRHAQELIHYRILNPDVAATARWATETSLRSNLTSRALSWAPSPVSVPARSPSASASIGPQFPPSPALTPQSALENDDDLERAIQKGEDSSDYESLYDSDAESLSSARTRRRKEQRPLKLSAYVNGAGPVHVPIAYPVRPPRQRAESEASDVTTQSDITTRSYASTSAGTPFPIIEELGTPIELDREPYDPVRDRGLLIGERGFIIRQRPSALRKKGLLVLEEVKEDMLARLADARASGEIPRRLVSRETDMRAYLDRADIEGIHPLRALLVAGYEPDEIPHFHLVYSRLAFRCAWEGLDALQYPFTDEELLEDEFDVNVRTLQERRQYDAELHVDGVWDEWVVAEAKLEANSKKRSERLEAKAERARRVAEKGKSRRLDVGALEPEPELEVEEDQDESLQLGLEYSWKYTDVDIPDLNMGLVAKVTKIRGLSTSQKTKQKRTSLAANDNERPTKRSRA